MRTMLPRLGFIDETSLKTNMAKTTGWAPCGARLVDHAPFGHWQTQTFIAALRHDRLDAPWVIGGAMNREFFDLHVETQLAPTLQKGDVVILDNLSTHKSPKAATLLKHIGAWFLLARISLADARSRKLMAIAGISSVIATAVIAAIGDISRFASPDRLASYFGLCFGVQN